MGDLYSRTSGCFILRLAEKDGISVSFYKINLLLFCVIMGLVNIVVIKGHLKEQLFTFGLPLAVIMAIVVGITSICVFLMSKPISAYQMGESYAQNMGLNVQLFRILLVLLSSILSACVTAFAGPVSFVGIAVPHLVKNLFGTAKPIIMIPACFLGGSVFCLLCDLLARIMFAPTELSISTITAVFGAPVVIYIMIHRKKEKV